MAAENTKTILFVDDERSVLSSLRRLMRREGWNLLFAESGMEGLERLKEREVDLVVSDMRMPQMDGAAILKQVQELYPDTTRIVLTRLRRPRLGDPGLRRRRHLRADPQALGRRRAQAGAPRRPRSLARPRARPAGAA